jgi:hypothetical protein
VLDGHLGFLFVAGRSLLILFFCHCLNFPLQ